MRVEPVDCTKAEEFEPIPPGTYYAQIAKIECKPTQAGGQYFKIQYVIVNDPQHSKRSVFDNVNYINENATAERIGRNTLGLIGKACGLATLTDTDQLVGRVLKIDVRIDEDKNYGRTNRVKGYHEADGTIQGAPQIPQYQQAQMQGFAQAQAQTQPAQGFFCGTQGTQFVQPQTQPVQPQAQPVQAQPQRQAPLDNPPWPVNGQTQPNAAATAIPGVWA